MDEFRGAVVVQVHRGVGAANNATYSLAAFLAAAGENSYFGDGAWSGQWTWLPEYDRPLGAPLGPPERDAADPLVFRRSFEHLGLLVDTRNSIAHMALF